MLFFYNQTIRQAAGHPAIKVNGEMIPYQDNTKILGTIFDYKLNFTKHIENRIKIAKYTKSKLTRFRTLNTKLQIYLFNTLALPQIHSQSHQYFMLVNMLSKKQK